MDSNRRFTIAELALSRLHHGRKVIEGIVQSYENFNEVYNRELVNQFTYHNLLQA